MPKRVREWFRTGIWWQSQSSCQWWKWICWKPKRYFRNQQEIKGSRFWLWFEKLNSRTRQRWRNGEKTIKDLTYFVYKVWQDPNTYAKFKIKMKIKKKLRIVLTHSWKNAIKWYGRCNNECTASQQRPEASKRFKRKFSKDHLLFAMSKVT